MLIPYQPRKPFHRRGRRVSPSLTPPVERVVRVRRIDEMRALWEFADRVAGVDDECPGLLVGGFVPVKVSIYSPNALLGTYEDDFSPGTPWRLVAADVHLTFDPPHRLVDATGTLQE